MLYSIIKILTIGHPIVKYIKAGQGRIPDISSNLPIVIDIIDYKDKIDLLPYLDEAVDKGLVMIEEVNSIKYTGN